MIEPGDMIVYVGRQDLKAHLNEARVCAVAQTDARDPQPTLVVRPTRSSSTLAQPSGRLVRLTVARKIVVLRKHRTRRTS